MIPRQIPRNSAIYMPNTPKQSIKTKPDDSYLEISPENSQRAYLNILEDMQSEKAAMEDQRIATFNIMEDITEAQEELKKRFGELDTLKELVQELGSSLKTTVVLQKLVDALKNTLPESTNFAYVIPSTDPGRQSNLVYFHAHTALGKSYLEAIKKDLELSIDTIPSIVKAKEQLVSWIQGKFLFEFIEGTRDNADTARARSSFNVPLVVRDEMLGVVNVSSSKAGLFTDKDISLANTMVSVTANTISRLQQLLASEQSRIQSLVESLSNGVIMFDLDQRVTMSNPAATQMTGLPEYGFYLTEFTKLFVAKTAKNDPKKKSPLETNIAHTLQSGESTKIDEVNLSRFSYEILITSVKDHEKNIIGGAIILHDITHIKEVDRMKTEFVSIASHQLRTPLTAIKLFVEMLQNEEAGKVSARQKEYLDNVYQSTNRMVKLVNDLLNVSRLETGRLKIEPKPTQLEDFVQGIIDEVELIAKNKKCKIAFNKPKEKLPMIPFDQSLMRQVVHNFITNAIRYSPEKMCDIVVSLGLTRGRTQKVTQKNAEDFREGLRKIPRSSADQDSILISVKDSGVGIPKEAQVRIFEKFYRADNARKIEAEGSGLGLYVVKLIVDASGGKVWFESVEGKGATFYVSYPLSGMVARGGERGLAGK